MAEEKELPVAEKKPCECGCGCMGVVKNDSKAAKPETDKPKK